MDFRFGRGRLEDQRHSWSLRSTRLPPKLAPSLARSCRCRLAYGSRISSWPPAPTINYFAAVLFNQMAGTAITIDRAYVRDHVGALAKNADLSKFIL